jgi:hypothetical protein
MSSIRALPAAVVLAFAPALLAQPVVVGGSLGPNDPQRPGGASYDEYEFVVEENQLVTIRMQSTTFDTYLIVRSPSGAELISDDYEGTMISQVDLIAPEAGRWVAWASSYSSGTVGDYTFTIRPRSTSNARLVQGRLDRQDQRALKGEYFDTHTFESDGRGEVMVQLTALGFDGYLVVTRPDGIVIRESGASAENMHVGPLPAMRGRWRVDVTSEAAGMVGAYDVRFIDDM